MGAFLFIFDLDRELCERVNLLVKSFQFSKDLLSLIKVSHLDFLYCVEHFRVTTLNASFEQNQIVRFNQTKFVWRLNRFAKSCEWYLDHIIFLSFFDTFFGNLFSGFFEI